MKGIELATAIDQARRLIESRLAEIDAEATQLERAVASLGEGSGPRRRGPGRPTKSVVAASASSRSKPGRRKRRPLKRAKRGQRQEQLLAAIKRMSGARPAELADAIGIGSNQAYGLIRAAEAEGKIEKRGQAFTVKT